MGAGSSREPGAGPRCCPTHKGGQRPSGARCPFRLTDIAIYPLAGYIRCGEISVAGYRANPLFYPLRVFYCPGISVRDSLQSLSMASLMLLTIQTCAFRRCHDLQKNCHRSACASLRKKSKTSPRTTKAAAAKAAAHPNTHAAAAHARARLLVASALRVLPIGSAHPRNRR